MLLQEQAFHLISHDITLKHDPASSFNKRIVDPTLITLVIAIIPLSRCTFFILFKYTLPDGIRTLDLTILRQVKNGAATMESGYESEYLVYAIVVYLRIRFGMVVKVY